MARQKITTNTTKWMWIFVLVLGSLFALPETHKQATEAAQTEAYFVLDVPPRHDQFVIKLTDPVKIQHARNLLANPQAAQRQVTGKIIKERVSYNRPWSFHFDPQTIDFFDLATEVCDGSIAYVETHLDEAGGAFLPGNIWCPWSSRLLKEIPPPVANNDFTSVSGASYRRAGLAEEAIVSAFGTNLAVATETAPDLPLPTTLAGTTVKVTDSLGIERLAPLFYVSPAQVNYLIPPASAPGYATVKITNANGATALERTQLLHLAPALFTANTNGQGAPAGLAVRVGEDGSFHLEPLARFDPGQNKFVPLPVEMGSDKDKVALVLFGTGLRRGDAAQAEARIDGVLVEILYLGAQPDYVGLDQVNLHVPRELAGRGLVNVELLVDDHKANSVTVHLK